jgi:hypothetical protein
LPRFGDPTGVENTTSPAFAEDGRGGGAVTDLSGVGVADVAGAAGASSAAGVTVKIALHF